MKGIALTCIFMVFALHQGVTASKPKIIPAKSWEVIEDGVFLIQEGDELRVECQGEGNLQISTEEFTAYVQQSEFEISIETEISKNSSSNSYTFTRPRTIKEDTGWYGCADESVKIKNDDQTIEHPGENISWIYVYVNSSNPFAVVDEGFQFPPVKVIVGPKGESKAVVPCRPTSPDLPVELYRASLPQPVGGNITYDPKIGFIINYVDASKYPQVADCKIAGSDARGPSFMLYVAAWDRLSDKDINTDDLGRVTTGNNLTLHCNMTSAMGIDVTMNWETPNSIALQEERLNISTPPSSKKNLRITRRKLLTILNADERDAGNYTCVVEGPFDTVRSSTKVEVLESPIFSGTETPLPILQRALLVKQIHAAEAQERAAISVQRVATTAQRFIEQLNKRSCPETNTD